MGNYASEGLHSLDITFLYCGVDSHSVGSAAHFSFTLYRPIFRLDAYSLRNCVISVDHPDCYLVLEKFLIMCTIKLRNFHGRNKVFGVHQKKICS
jgi:hypothetical protein